MLYVSHKNSNIPNIVINVKWKYGENLIFFHAQLTIFWVTSGHSRAWHISKTTNGYVYFVPLDYWSCPPSVKCIICLRHIIQSCKNYVSNLLRNPKHHTHSYVYECPWKPMPILRFLCNKWTVRSLVYQV